MRKARLEMIKVGEKGIEGNYVQFIELPDDATDNDLASEIKIVEEESGYRCTDKEWCLPSSMLELARGLK